jgi:hypothetical protein
MDRCVRRSAAALGERRRGVPGCRRLSANASLQDHAGIEMEMMDMGSAQIMAMRASGARHMRC